MWFNYAQWWSNRETTQLKQKPHESQGLVKPPLFVYCGWLSSALLLLLQFKCAGHARCWYPCVVRVSPVMEITLELLAFACGCFQSDDILYMFVRSWVGVWGVCFFSPGAFSVLVCLFGCSFPDQTDQLLYANLMLTDKVKSELSDMFRKAWFFELLPKKIGINIKIVSLSAVFSYVGR